MEGFGSLSCVVLTLSYYGNLHSLFHHIDPNGKKRIPRFLCTTLDFLILTHCALLGNMNCKEKFTQAQVLRVNQ